MTVADLPAVNASLNALAAVLLVAGYACIRRGSVRAHRACMGSAFAVSGCFLASYLTYHWHAGHVRFQGEGPLRNVYFAILVSHTALAVINVPLILRTLYLALRGRFEAHRRAARWAFPVWLYVSVTGVVVYLMLYGMSRRALTSAEFLLD